MKRDRKKQKGFTLVEIMIVIGIIATLFGLVGPRVMDALRGSKTKIAAIQMKSYEQALQSYYAEAGFFPNTQQGLQALLSKPTVGRVPNNYPPNGFLSKKTLEKDPWGSDYRYVCEDYQQFTLTSDGPDLQSGTEDDIKNDE